MPRPSKRSLAAKKAAATKRRLARERSEAAKRGAATRKRKAAELAAKRSAAAAKGWKTRRKKALALHAEEAGDIAALSIVIYDERAPLILPLLEPYFLRHFPRAGSYEAQGTWNPDDKYRLNITFRKPLNAPTVAARLEQIPCSILPTDGARMHMGAYLFDGEYLPLSHAFTDPCEVFVEAIQRLLRGELTYEAPESSKSRYRRKPPRERKKRRATVEAREKDNARRRAYYKKHKSQEAATRRAHYAKAGKKGKR